MKNYFQICLFNRVTIGQMVRPRSLIANKSKEFQGIFSGVRFGIPRLVFNDW